MTASRACAAELAAGRPRPVRRHARRLPPAAGQNASCETVASTAGAAQTTDVAGQAMLAWAAMMRQPR
jgi:hypothetical protein